jgi:hypothetical protein
VICRTVSLVGVCCGLVVRARAGGRRRELAQASHLRCRDVEQLRDAWVGFFQINECLDRERTVQVDRVELGDEFIAGVVRIEERRRGVLDRGVTSARSASSSARR